MWLDLRGCGYAVYMWWVWLCSYRWWAWLAAAVEFADQAVLLVHHALFQVLERRDPSAMAGGPRGVASAGTGIVD